MDETKPDWSSAVLLERLPDQRSRKRLAAGLGIALLLAGMLVAVGLGLVVAALVVLALAFWAGRLARRALEARRVAIRFRTKRTFAAARTVGGRAKPVARSGAGHLGATTRTGVVRLGSTTRTGVVRLGATTRTGVVRLRATTKTALAQGERGSSAAAASLRSATDRARDAATSKVRAHELRKEALRLNTAGSSFRRGGDPARAVEQHAQALELVRAVGDRLGEALTLNNLGLALGATGDEEAAIQRFEEAHTIARELDAAQYDGLIAANLATAYRRRGHEAQATRFLAVALEKLPRDSGAYHRVEEQLTNAS
jgi:tetratricopeptide (TPR) repeat protein